MQTKGNNGPRYRHQAQETSDYTTIRVDKLTPIIGAEISGIDLSKPLAPEQQNEVHRAGVALLRADFSATPCR